MLGNGGEEVLRSAARPAPVAHTYDAPCLAEPYCVVTLTVGDAAGHSDSDAITMAFIDETPD